MHKLVVYDHNINLSCGKYRRDALDTRKERDLEEKSEISTYVYILLKYQQNTGQNRDVKMVNMSFEIVAKENVRESQ